MGKDINDKQRDDELVPTEKKLDELYELIDGIQIAMFTTRRRDGHLVSRPMDTQERTSGTDLWFVTDIETHKLEELASDPHVNLAYLKGHSEWVSVSGTAIITQDRDLVRELYKPDWKAWFAREGDERSGTPEDPRIALILVEAHSVTYLKQDKPKPVQLFEFVKGMVTSSPPDMGTVRHISESELPLAASREAR